ncbi:MAG: xanthine dehydrogenase family protein molybdopterin-binding subunit [Gammaproteobacteria bacterium]|nr:xanthine dehydrogenase family protein molybdopterin-binding subunit [Gammaproteobacteria bacterium]
MVKPTVPQIGEPARRIDGVTKAIGSHVYPSDYVIEGMLRLRILRAEHPHARILSINTSTAEQVPGVVRIFTAADIPGKNGVHPFNIDGPVLCEDRVRCVGDAVAIVAAETDEAAIRARDLVEVEYDLLPVIADVYEAMEPNAYKIHPDGNILCEIHNIQGDVADGFADADFIFENDYVTGRQEHIPMETEAGAAFYDENGLLTIRHGGQYPHRDHAQIAEFLAVSEQDVRVLTPMVGGSFGGKDEFTVQCHLALVTYLTKQPSYIMLDREESIIATTKRHPFYKRYKIACDRNGKLQAAEIRMIADTGAHASWGYAVLKVATETCLGPYYIPNVKLDAYCVYTNNCVSGAFRGFGGLQGSIGIESQMDEMARKLEFDPLELRRINELQPGQQAPSGFVYNAKSSSLNQVLDEVEVGPIYSRRDELKALSPPQDRWTKRGVGVSAAWMCVGYGHGIPDSAEVRLESTKKGHYRLLVGGVDMGQGNATAFAQIVANEMNCAIDQVEVHIGDSAGPDTGACDAVRTMYITSAAVVKAAQDLRHKILEKFSSIFGCEYEEVELVGTAGKNIASGNTMAIRELGVLTGNGIVRIYQENPEDNTDDFNAWVFTYSAQAALVEVDVLTGKVNVLKFHSAVDAGKVVNRQGFEGQSEGGIAQSIGYTLMEDCVMDEGRVLNPALSTYVAPYIIDIPDEIITTAVENPDPNTPFGVKGIAEIVMCPTPSAILNAVYDAVGVRYTQIPLTPERVLEKLSYAS